MVKNIAYQTDQIANYFSKNRVTWSQFYDSERAIIGRLGLGEDHTVLDIGCGCGGLGLALRAQFGVKNYSGVEINSLAADAARTLNPNANVWCGDFLDLRQDTLREKQFDVVFSLSCFDWNIQFAEMLAAAWDHVSSGGTLVATFRLTASDGCNDMTRSYQFINYDGLMDGERAPYVVLNVRELLGTLSELNPSAISAFGYFGTPSSTAQTPYEKICFAAFSIGKRTHNELGAVRIELDLPEEISATIPAPQIPGL